MVHPFLFFFLKIAAAIQGHLWFHINFWNVCSVPVTYVIGTATVENSIEFPQKIKMELPFDPVILLLEIYPKNPKSPV